MFQVGDKIVYPMHGAGVIEAIEEKEILGEKQRYYVIKMPIGNMQVMVPTANVSNLGMRPTVDMLTLESALFSLHCEEPEQSLPWNQKYRMCMDKLRTGDIQESVEVVRDLTRRSEEKKLNMNEKSMLDNAKRILVSEVALVKGFTKSQAIDFLNEEIYS